MTSQIYVDTFVVATSVACLIAGKRLKSPLQAQVYFSKLVRATLVLLLWVTVEAWGQGYGEKIYANNRHAVVTVLTFDAAGNAKGLGTGFITASTGEVVTNYHVVEGASFLMMKQLTGALFPVDGWLACSQAQDFAVLKVNGKELPTVKLGALKAITVGQRVFALGSPLGMEQTFTDGMVSSLRDGSELNRPEIPKVIQHTAPISPGNSGSPLFNSQGQVIGINTLILVGGQNLNFAIPIDYIKTNLGKTEVKSFPIKRTALSGYGEPVSQTLIGKDGAPMVLIPAGEFEMGTDVDEIPGIVKWAKLFHSNASASWLEHETPRHTVYLDAFYIDVYEVTNAQYQKFMDATGHKAPGYWNGSDLNQPNQPVVGVSWYDAMAYAKWAGKRLPTEAEWEKAARGGLVGKQFPWGNEDPDGTQCNLADTNTNIDWSVKTVDDGYQSSSPVGTYPPNGYGLYDMAGNVWEWCMDEYQRDSYKISPRRNPMAGGTILGVIDNFTSVKSPRSLRGGSWDFAPNDVRVANRNRGDPTNAYDYVGFRCAGSVPP